MSSRKPPVTHLITFTHSKTGSVKSFIWASKDAYEGQKPSDYAKSLYGAGKDSLRGVNLKGQPKVVEYGINIYHFTCDRFPN